MSLTPQIRKTLSEISKPNKCGYKKMPAKAVKKAFERAGADVKLDGRTYIVKDGEGFFSIPAMTRGSRKEAITINPSISSMARRLLQANEAQSPVPEV